MSASKLHVIHPVKAAFAYDIDYRTYRFYNYSQKYNVKMAARTAKLAKRVETIIKPYKFENLDPVTILLFLGQFKRASDSSGILEEIAMWLFPFYMAKPTAPSLTT